MSKLYQYAVILCVFASVWSKANDGSYYACWNAYNRAGQEMPGDTGIACKEACAQNAECKSYAFNSQTAKCMIDTICAERKLVADLGWSFAQIPNSPCAVPVEPRMLAGPKGFVFPTCRKVTPPPVPKTQAPKLSTMQASQPMTSQALKPQTQAPKLPPTQASQPMTSQALKPVATQTSNIASTHIPKQITTQKLNPITTEVPQFVTTQVLKPETTQGVLSESATSEALKINITSSSNETTVESDNYISTTSPPASESDANATTLDLNAQETPAEAEGTTGVSGQQSTTPSIAMTTKQLSSDIAVVTTEVKSAAVDTSQQEQPVSIPALPDTSPQGSGFKLKLFIGTTALDQTVISATPEPDSGNASNSEEATESPKAGTTIKPWGTIMNCTNVYNQDGELHDDVSQSECSRFCKGKCLGISYNAESRKCTISMACTNTVTAAQGWSYAFSTKNCKAAQNMNRDDKDKSKFEPSCQIQ